jgi:hypothetical protein
MTSTWNGSFVEDVVQERDRGLLGVALIHPQYPEPGAVIDGGVLVVALRRGPGDGVDELHVDLDPMTGELFLVALPAAVVALVALIGGQAAHVGPFEDPPDTGLGDLDVVIALQVHGDLVGPEVVVLAQIHDLADHLFVGGVRAVMGATGSVLEALDAELFVAAEPPVEGLATDAVEPACLCDIAAHLSDAAQHRQAVTHDPLLLSFVHRSLS